MSDISGASRSPLVLIVGAGPTGLTLAVELARAGVPFRLVESAPGPQPGSRGKGVQPRTLEVFEDLGIVDRVLAHGRLAMPIRSTGPDGQVTVTGDEPPEPRPDIPYAASLITPEWRIEEALRLRLGDLGGAVEFGTALTGFTQAEDEVTATLVREGVVETVPARWLVGCDGGHSLVRRQAGITFDGETLDEVRMIVADVEVDGLDRDCWHLWRHREGMFSLCPLPSTTTFQCQASIAPGQDPDLALPNLQRILERRTGRTDLRLAEPGWVSLWRANIRLVDRYREGSVFLAGDAAHIHSPAGGQGMNTGIQDAHNLAWKLAAVAGGASPTLLDSYQDERRPVAVGVLALSNARLAQAIEGRGIVTGGDRSTRQLGIGYRDSVLSRDDRDDTAELRAGDRAPDATGLTTAAGERRLFELIGAGRFTVLDFGTAGPGGLPAGVRHLRVVERAVTDGEVADTAGRLAAAYRPTGESLVVIRPDGCLGLISDAGDRAAVTDYLTGLLGCTPPD